jgi:hypothetical protein
MRKVIDTIVMIIAVFSLFLTGAENPDGSVNLCWSMGCLGVAGLCALWLHWSDRHPAKKGS